MNVLWEVTPKTGGRPLPGSAEGCNRLLGGPSSLEPLPAMPDRPLSTTPCFAHLEGLEELRGGCNCWWVRLWWLWPFECWELFRRERLRKYHMYHPVPWFTWPRTTPRGHAGPFQPQEGDCGWVRRWYLSFNSLFIRLAWKKLSKATLDTFPVFMDSL